MSKTHLVKLFSGADKSIVENQVNTFLKTLNEQELLDVKFTSGDGTFDVMVHYEKKLIREWSALGKRASLMLHLSRKKRNGALFVDAEKLKIFDDGGNYLGVATREDVHRIGYWHETFHCWFIKRHEEKNYLLFQVRSGEKKDFPNLLDVTAAGHLLHHEAVTDGIREIKEEIGIDLEMSDLIPLGMIKDEIISGNIMDKELAHVFIHFFNMPIHNLELQKSEVSGIVQIEFNEFYDFWMNDRKCVGVEDLELNDESNAIEMKKTLKRDSFLPHNHAYYSGVLERIKGLLDKK